jgi:membrane associated rhomboid family serine protease
MLSFGLLGAIFGVPGLLIFLMPGIDSEWWLPFKLYTIAYPWLVFAGLTSNTFLRGRQIRGLLKEGKIKLVD